MPRKTEQQINNLKEQKRLKAVEEQNEKQKKEQEKKQKLSNQNFIDYYRKLLLIKKEYQLKKDNTSIFKWYTNAIYSYFLSMIDGNLKELEWNIRYKWYKGDFTDEELNKVWNIEQYKMNFDYTEELETLFEDFKKLDFVENELKRLYTLKWYFTEKLPLQIKNLIQTVYNLIVFFIVYLYNKVKNYVLSKINRFVEYTDNIINKDTIDKYIQEQKEKLYK